MKRLAALLCWSLVTILLLLAIDQLFLRIPLRQPAAVTVRSFYLDFRVRLLSLWSGPSGLAVEGLIEKTLPSPQPLRPAAPEKTTAPQGAVEEPGYVYADVEGELHFVGTLNDIPARYRRDAQRLVP